MSQGVMMYAHNNEHIDYISIALCNALAIKFNLNVPICLVTDEGSMKWLSKTHKNLIDYAFDHIIFQKPKGTEKKFNDTLSTSYTLPWYNFDRADSYGLTPFNETLLIDCDYLILDKSLNLVWNSIHDMMINRKIIPLDHGNVSSNEKWLEHTGIELCWATCVYFRKSKLAESVFDIIQHIKDNYDYYSMVYGYKTLLYRNDYVFSIAIHMMSGFTRCQDIPSLPSPFLFTSFDRDELIDVPSKGDLVFLMNDQKEQWKFTLTRTKNINVHVINKFSIIRQAHKFIDLYRVSN